MKRKQLYIIIAAIIFLDLLYYQTANLIFIFSSFSFHLVFSNLLDIFSGLLGITATLIFIFSGFKKTRLFKLYLCLVIYSFPFVVWFHVKYFTHYDDFGFYNERPLVQARQIINIVFSIITTTASFTGLWLLTRNQKIKLTTVRYGDKIENQFSPARAGLRFINRLIDSLIIIYFLYYQLIRGRLLTTQPFSSDYLSLMAIEFSLLVMYYLLLESIFNTTAGKCATNTIIVNENGERPNFGQILGRTFARLIPFDALSFLGARGWHDSLSGTYVVAAAGNKEEINEITLDAELNQQQ